MHERHAQHVGMHVVESIELIHGSAVLQSTHLDQIRALCDVCATCAASRTIAHSSVWSVSECGGGGLCWRRRRLFSRHHRGQTATADGQSVRWLMCVMHVAMRGRGRVRRIGRARRRRSQLLHSYKVMVHTRTARSPVRALCSHRGRTLLNSVLRKRDMQTGAGRRRCF